MSKVAKATKKSKATKVEIVPEVEQIVVEIATEPDYDEEDAEDAEYEAMRLKMVELEKKKADKDRTKKMSEYLKNCDNDIISYVADQKAKVKAFCDSLGLCDGFHQMREDELTTMYLEDKNSDTFKDLATMLWDKKNVVKPEKTVKVEGDKVKRQPSDKPPRPKNLFTIFKKPTLLRQIGKGKKIVGYGMLQENGRILSTDQDGELMSFEGDHTNTHDSLNTFGKNNNRRLLDDGTIDRKFPNNNAYLCCEYKMGDNWLKMNEIWADTVLEM